MVQQKCALRLVALLFRPPTLMGLRAVVDSVVGVLAALLALAIIFTVAFALTLERPTVTPISAIQREFSVTYDAGNRSAHAAVLDLVLVLRVSNPNWFAVGVTSLSLDVRYQSASTTNPDGYQVGRVQTELGNVNIDGNEARDVTLNARLEPSFDGQVLLLG